MHYRRLGSSDLQLSELSLGSCTTYGHQPGNGLARQRMGAAYDARVNFFDNAEVYAPRPLGVAPGLWRLWRQPQARRGNVPGVRGAQLMKRQP